MNIKLFTKDYLDECAKEYAEVFSSDPWNEQWNIEVAKKRISNLLSQPNFLSYFFLTKENSAGGFIGGMLEVWCDGIIFRLEEFFINSKYQRKGLGTKLIKYLEKELKIKGVVRIYLNTKRNSTAEKFYKNNSFKSENNIVCMTKTI